MAHLKTLLATREGRHYVACCLAEAFDKNKEIRPGLPRAPYPHMTLDDVAQTETEDIARRAHLILHVNKSRETDQGWIVVEECPNPHDFLAPTMEVDRKSMGQLLRDNTHLQDQVTQLQERGTELVLENRKLKNPPLPDFVGWWQNFDEHTRQQVYVRLGRDQENRSKNGANFSAQAILEWVAKDPTGQGWDRYMAAEEWKKQRIDAERKAEHLQQALDNVRVECHKCGGSYPIDERLYCDDCIQRYYQMQCESCGSNIPQKDGCYCEDCHGNESDLEERLAELEKLLGQAVVQMNKKGPPDSEWMKKYRSLHEKYLHQTPTGKNVDLEDELFRMKGARNKLEDQKRKLEQEVAHLKAKVETAQSSVSTMLEKNQKLVEELKAEKGENKRLLEMHDGWTEEIIDELEPHFYDCTTVNAQGGADYPQILSAIRELVEIAVPDFAAELQRKFDKGMSDSAIAAYYRQMEGDEGTEGLVTLIRKQMEKKT